MIKKRLFAFAFAMLLAAGLVLPVFALDTEMPQPTPTVSTEQGIEPSPIEPLPVESSSPPPEPIIPPAFSAELRLSFDGWGLMGTLSEITADMLCVTPCYSLDRSTYLPVEYNNWNISEVDNPTLLRQQCFWEIQSPLAEYLSGEIDSFSIRLKITYQDSSVYFTQAVFFERGDPTPLPDSYLVQGWYDGPVRIIAYRPIRIWGQYHFTVADTATPEELTALLPTQVPVELQIGQPGQTAHSVVVLYTVTWPESPSLTGECTEILADRVTPPEQCTVSIGTERYVVEHLDEIPLQGPELRATFHSVASGTASSLLLSSNANAQPVRISATLPWKPTDSQTIIPEYSLDGETNWIPLEDVLADTPLEDTPPKQESYTVGILDDRVFPFNAYQDGSIPGFYLRLSISGGPLAGKTQVAAWPADYDYVPPRDDSNDSGSGGNRGDAGSGSSSGSDSSSSGGQRPDLPVILPTELPSLPSEVPDTVTAPPSPTPTPAVIPSDEPLPFGEPVKTADTSSIELIPVNMDIQPPPPSPSSHGAFTNTAVSPPSPTSVPTEPTAPEPKPSTPLATPGPVQEPLAAELEAQPLANTAFPPVTATAAAVLVGGGIAVTAISSAVAGSKHAHRFSKLFRILQKWVKR